MNEKFRLCQPAGTPVLRQLFGDLELSNDVETGVFRLAHIASNAALRFGAGTAEFIKRLNTRVLSPLFILEHEHIPHGLFIPAE